MGAEIVAGLLPVHVELVADVQSNLIGVSGGFGSAKTHGAAIKTLALAEVNAPIPVLFAEPTYPLITKTAVPMFREILVDWGLWKKTRYAKRDQQLIIPMNGKECHIWFINAGDADALAGPNVAAGVIDEAGLDDIKENAARQIRARIRHGKARVRQLIAIGTPDQGKRGWFYDWFADRPSRSRGSKLLSKTKRGEVWEYLEGKGETEHKVRVRLMRAPTRENYFNPPDYIAAALGGLDEVNRKRYEEGEFIDLHGRVYTQYDEDVHCVELDDLGQGEPVMMCDFGSGIMAWGFGEIVQTVDDYGEPIEVLRVIGEQILEGNVDTGDAGKQARAWWRQYFFEHLGEHVEDEAAASMVTAYGDPSGGPEFKGSMSDFKILEGLGFATSYRPAKFRPKVKDRVNSLQEKLRRVEFFIDGRRAPYLEKCLRLQGYNARGTPEKWRGRDGAKGLDHGNDAISYLTERRWRVSSGHGVESYDTH